MSTPASNVRNLRPMDAPEATKVLRIVAGLHAGASRALADQEMLVVGSGDDCDIVLADTGVAAHHALITLVGGVFTLRALDAPLRIEGKPLHPGDPVEVRPLQRIDLGEAAIAFGGQDEAAWDALFPAIADKARKQRAKPFLRKLPLVAAAAVVGLLLVALVAALIPRRDTQVDARAYLQSLTAQHRITQHEITTDATGAPVLVGTVESEATRSRIEQQLRESGVEASLALRTGEKMARDVREVFRMAGIGVDTRYLGDGRVEINGNVDQTKFRQVLESRAMADVGAADLVPGEGLTGIAGTAPAGTADAEASVAAQPAVDIVSVVRGKQPYVVDSNGAQYPLGETIPGHGKLIAIASQIWVEGPNAELKQIRPITAAELAARAESAANGPDFKNVNSGNPASPEPVDPSSAQRAVNTAQEKIPANRQ